MMLVPAINRQTFQNALTSILVGVCSLLVTSPMQAEDQPVCVTLAAQFDDESESLGSPDEQEYLGPIPSLSEIAGPVVEFLQQPVSSVARQPSTVGRSPAAVFVLSQEMIRRSGARSVPEVLRLVPGLHVARIDANKWSISSRGFSGRFARKLLVQIDGRIAYTPLFGGTTWDVQDLLLNDVERIEVIRGPGATVWGANAVNGIINIITKSAEDTHGL